MVIARRLLELNVPAIKIIKRSVDAATAGAEVSMFWDQDLSGFGLKVSPTGSKTYLVQY
jgi:hypothetical protein